MHKDGEHGNMYSMCRFGSYDEETGGCLNSIENFYVHAGL